MFDTGADFTSCFRYLNKFQMNNDAKKIDDIKLDVLVDYLIPFCCSLDELKEHNKAKYPKECVLNVHF